MERRNSCARCGRRMRPDKLKGEMCYECTRILNRIAEGKEQRHTREAIEAETVIPVDAERIIEWWGR